MLLYNPRPAKDHSQIHYPLQCVFLKLNASWPTRKPLQTANSRFLGALYTAWSWYVIVSVSVTCGFQAAFLIRNFGDILKMTENMCTTLMGLLNLMRLLHLRLNQRSLRRLIAQFAEHIWIEKDTHPAIEARCRVHMRTFRIMSLLTAGLIAMYVTMPLAEYYGSPAAERDNTAKPFPYKMLFFYDAQRTWRYVLTYVFTSQAGICVVTTLFAEDSFFGFYVVYACGQIQLLHQRIRHLLPEAHAHAMSKTKTDDKVSYSRHYQRECRRRLKAIAIKHRQIIAFAHALEQFFSGVLLVNFLISSVLICMVGFQLMTSQGMFIGDLLKLVLYISSSFSQLGVLCWQGDALIEHSTATVDCLYACNWEGGTTNFNTAEHRQHLTGNPIAHKLKQKFKQPLLLTHPTVDAKQIHFEPVDQVFRVQLRFMMLCSQKPLRITAFKFSTLSLQSFTAIISTSMSYFTLLQSVYKKMEPN